MDNKHGILIIAEGFSAFVDGVPDTCEHKWDGDPVYTAASGKKIYWRTYRRWAHLTTQARYELLMEHHTKIDDPIVEMTSTCSKCKKSFNPLHCDL